jgi:hypothetical protein
MTQGLQSPPNEITGYGDADSFRNDESKADGVGLVGAKHVHDRMRGHDTTTATHEATVIICPD